MQETGRKAKLEVYGWIACEKGEGRLMVGTGAPKNALDNCNKSDQTMQAVDADVKISGSCGGLRWKRCLMCPTMLCCECLPVDQCIRCLEGQRDCVAIGNLVVDHRKADDESLVDEVSWMQGNRVIKVVLKPTPKIKPSRILRPTQTPETRRLHGSPEGQQVTGVPQPTGTHGVTMRPTSRGSSSS